MAIQNINQTLPSEYKQYSSIYFCGNTFNNLKYLIDDNGFIPFLIGVGEIPRLWLYVKKENNSLVVVRDNIAILPTVKVDVFSKDKKLKVELSHIPNVEDMKIFEIDFSGSIPNVNHIDLRPIGYNIFGDKTELTIGVNKFKNRIFSNIHTLIKIENNNNN